MIDLGYCSCLLACWLKGQCQGKKFRSSLQVSSIVVRVVVKTVGMNKAVETRS